MVPPAVGLGGWGWARWWARPERDACDQTGGAGPGRRREAQPAAAPGGPGWGGARGGEATYLGGLEVGLGVAAGELIQQRLEDIEDQVGVLLPTLGSQVADDNLVILHEVLVAYVDLPVLPGHERCPHGPDTGLWGGAGGGLGSGAGVHAQAQSTWS